jgi:hypothetical protein
MTRNHATEWLLSARPAVLLYMIQRLPNRGALRLHRKHRLFACGCFTLIWDRITLPTTREAVIKTEEWVDRKISRQELERYRLFQGNPPRGTTDWYLQMYIDSLITRNLTPTHVAWIARRASDPARRETDDKWADCPSQANLVREVFGNPFQPVEFDRRWCTGTVTTIARQMYEARDFSATPILADALQDAGCDSAELLDHCRGPGPHVRGCWVVDKLLARQ